MRNIFALLLSIAVFAATVAMVNAFGGGTDGLANEAIGAGFSFDIQAAVMRLAAILGDPIEQIALQRQVPLPGGGQAALGVGIFGLVMPSVFSFVLFGRA